MYLQSTSWDLAACDLPGFSVAVSCLLSCLGIPREEQRQAYMNERNVALTRCTFVCVQPIADAESSWEIAYPGNVIQFLCLIYHSYTQDPVWHCPDFLKTLATVAFHSGPPKVCASEPA